MEGIFLVNYNLFYAFANCSEGFWITDGEFGKNFAVEFNTLAFHTIDELAVANTIFASGVINARNPESAQIAFAITAIAIGIAKGFNDALFGEAETTGAVMLHPLSSF